MFRKNQSCTHFDGDGVLSVRIFGNCQLQIFFLGGVGWGGVNLLYVGGRRSVKKKAMMISVDKENNLVRKEVNEAHN